MSPEPAAQTAGPVANLERHQVAIYLGAIAAGAVLGHLAPEAGAGLEHAITPALGTLLFVTFLQVPVARFGHALRGARFLAAALVVNFVAVPLLVTAMFVFLPGEPALRLGVLLVLLCPCVDYVIVFSGLAGADSEALLAITPLLLIAQLAALPIFLWAFLGPGLADIVEISPFVTAFVSLIVLPLALAGLTQTWAARRRPGERAMQAATATMVPLMALTLLVVVASQVPRLDGNTGPVLRLVPFYVVFLVVMAFAGTGVARLFLLPIPGARAIVFSGATRNSLVVLPLALALPDHLAIAAVAVVTQTLVEVVGMVVYVRAIPRLIPTPPKLP